MPTGADWLHEVKFDGYRVQAHKLGTDVVIFSRNGHDFTSRFATIAYVLRELPAKSAILDGELVASDEAAQPDFGKLHRRFVEPGRGPPLGLRPAGHQRPGSGGPTPWRSARPACGPS